MARKSEQEKKDWEAMELEVVGDVGEVLQVSVGGGKPSIPNQPDFGMETPNSPRGLE